MSDQDDFYALVAQALETQQGCGGVHRDGTLDNVRAVGGGRAVIAAGGDPQDPNTLCEILIPPNHNTPSRMTDVSGFEVREWRFLPPTQRDGTDSKSKERSAKRLKELKLGSDGVLLLEEELKEAERRGREGLGKKGADSFVNNKGSEIQGSSNATPPQHTLLSGSGDSPQFHGRSNDPELVNHHHGGQQVMKNNSAFQSSSRKGSGASRVGSASPRSRQIIASLAPLNPTGQDDHNADVSSPRTSTKTVTLLDRYIPNWTATTELPPRETKPNSARPGSGRRVTQRVNGRGKSCIVPPPPPAAAGGGGAGGGHVTSASSSFGGMKKMNIPLTENPVDDDPATAKFFMMQSPSSAYTSRPSDIARTIIDEPPAATVGKKEKEAVCEGITPPPKSGAQQSSSQSRARARQQVIPPTTPGGAAGYSVIPTNPPVQSNDILLPAPPTRRPHVLPGGVAETVEVDRLSSLVLRIGGNDEFGGDDGGGGLGIGGRILENSTTLGRAQNVSPTRRSAKVIMVDHTSAYLFDDTNNWVLFFDPRDQVSTVGVSTIVSYNRLQSEAGPTAIRLMKIGMGEAVPASGGDGDKDDDGKARRMRRKGSSSPTTTTAKKTPSGKSRPLRFKRRPQHPGVDLTIPLGGGGDNVDQDSDSDDSSTQNAVVKTSGEQGSSSSGPAAAGGGGVKAKVDTVAYWKNKTRSLIAPSAQRMPKTLERHDLLEVLEGDDLELLVAGGNNRRGAEGTRRNMSPNRYLSNRNTAATSIVAAPNSKSIFAVTPAEKRKREADALKLVWNIEASGRFKSGSGKGKPYGWNWFSPTKSWESDFQESREEAVKKAEELGTVTAEMIESIKLRTPRPGFVDHSSTGGTADTAARSGGDGVSPSRQGSNYSTPQRNRTHSVPFTTPSSKAIHHDDLGECSVLSASVDTVTGADYAASRRLTELRSRQSLGVSVLGGGRSVKVVPSPPNLDASLSGTLTMTGGGVRSPHSARGAGREHRATMSPFHPRMYTMAAKVRKMTSHSPTAQ